MIANALGLFFRPKHQWQTIADQSSFSLFKSLIYTLILACIPALAWFYGTTETGWTVGEGENIRLTKDSGMIIISLFYLVMVASICVIGYAIHWMAQTYGSDSTIAKGIAVAGFSATPLFLAGAVGFLPAYGLDLLVAIVALSYAVYLLYLGIPKVMDIPEERGFLYASAVVAVCMVIVMIIMGGTVILWGMGAEPQFTN